MSGSSALIKDTLRCTPGLPCGSVVKNPPANAGDAADVGLFPELGRFSGGRNGTPLQYSCLGNPKDGGAWWATVHGAAEADKTETELPSLFQQLSTDTWTQKWVLTRPCSEPDRSPSGSRALRSALLLPTSHLAHGLLLQQLEQTKTKGNEQSS